MTDDDKPNCLTLEEMQGLWVQADDWKPDV